MINNYLFEMHDLQYSRVSWSFKMLKTDVHMNMHNILESWWVISSIISNLFELVLYLVSGFFLKKNYFVVQLLFSIKALCKTRWG